MAPRQDEVISKIIKSIVTLSKEILQSKKEEVNLDLSPTDNQAEKSNIVFVGPTKQSQEETESTPKISEEKSLFSNGVASRITSSEIRDTLAAFMIRAVVLDPKYQFNIQHEMNNDEVQRLIQTCVNKITDCNDIEMETIKMQVYFDTNFPSQGNN
jgi:hypothetical protein